MRAVLVIVFSRSNSSGAPSRANFLRPSQRDLDVARAELDRIVEVAVLALVPDLDRAAVARLLLADAHAFRVVAVGAEGRGAAGADPLVAALVAALLLLEPLAQRLHQLFPAAERLDLLLLLLGELQLHLLQQPLERNLRPRCRGSSPRPARTRRRRGRTCRSSPRPSPARRATGSRTRRSTDRSRPCPSPRAASGTP